MKAELELQADRIELLLNGNGTPARVTGGVVTPRRIHYRLNPALGTRLASLQGMSEELAEALNVPNIHVSRNGAQFQISVPRPNPPDIDLLDLERRLPAVPLATAVLGLADDGAPLLLRLTSPDVSHVLVTGEEGTGKTTQLTTIAHSLGISHRPHQLQIHAADPEKTTQLSFLEAQHSPQNPLFPLVQPVATSPQAAVDSLRTLAGQVESRRHLEHDAPQLVGIIDDLQALPPADIQAALDEVLVHGQDAGVHLVTAISPQTLDRLPLSRFPVRLVGKVPSAEAALQATGMGGSGADRLDGAGDFLAVSRTGISRYQAARLSQHHLNVLTDLPQRFINPRLNLLDPGTE